MHPSPFAVSLGPEPYGSEGPRWVVAQAEAELVARYGGLDDGERGLTAAMFDPPSGVFIVARVDGASDPVGGVGLRAVAAGTGEVRRFWVDPAWRGNGIGRDLRPPSRTPPVASVCQCSSSERETASPKRSRCTRLRDGSEFSSAPTVDRCCPVGFASARIFSHDVNLRSHL